MIYEVELDDGTTVQINANSNETARRLAVAKFKGRLAVSVRKAGLLGMLQRRPHPLQHQKS